MSVRKNKHFPQFHVITKLMKKKKIYIYIKIILYIFEPCSDKRGLNSLPNDKNVDISKSKDLQTNFRFGSNIDICL